MRSEYENYLNLNYIELFLYFKLNLNTSYNYKRFSVSIFMFLILTLYQRLYGVDLFCTENVSTMQDYQKYEKTMYVQ